MATRGEAQVLHHDLRGRLSCGSRMARGGGSGKLLLRAANKQGTRLRHPLTRALTHSLPEESLSSSSLRSYAKDSAFREGCHAGCRSLGKTCSPEKLCTDDESSLSRVGCSI